MRNPALVITMLASAIILSLMAVAVSGQDPSNPNDALALVGGTIYVSPNDDPIRDGTVLIQSGKVVEVGSRDSVQLPGTVPSLDCSGLVVTAGFWNSHVHLFERKWASAATIPAAELDRQLSDMFARYGFTSVFDIGSMWENTRRLRDRIESGEVAGPRIRSTGEALVAPGAIPSARILGILGFMTFPAPEIVNATQAATAARKLIDEGVDAIKIHLQPPPPPNPPFAESAIEAAVREAHRSGKPVFVHPNTGADVLASVRAGADVIAHTTPSSGPWEETTVEAMKAGQVALTPTLTLWKSAMRHDRISVQEGLVQTAIGQLRAWFAKGGTVLFGTDLGAVDYDPVLEYVLMAEAGMSFHQILASLTTTPAERFGAGQMGRIARGQDADLVVIEGDPSEDIRALARVRYTVRAGKILYRASQ